ncbi:unnamed protein product [Sphagnum jensenii]|uniref:Ribulose-1,5-bisphosphate carboxylase/oxygenase large subunit n=1 Tax=Sphagnum jensenii TaxID=128206 RepID=A0ABP0VUK4_9BRYO
MSSFLPLATYSHTLKSRSSLQGPLGSPVGLRTGWPDETRSMASSVKALPHDRAGPSVQENEEQHGAMIELQQL